jgi:phage tail sheath gpL-like
MSGVAYQYIPQNFIPPLFYVEFNNQDAGVQGNTAQPALVIGQMVSGNPAVAGVPFYVPSPAQAMAQCGAKSAIARMCSTYLTADPVGPLWALPLADASGSAAATCTLTLTGAATGAETHYLYVGNKQLQVGVNIGDSASTQATNISNTVNSAVLVPVIAASSAGVVTFTAVNKGLQGNNIVIALNPLGLAAGQSLPAGVTATITAMTGGATDADLGTVAADIGDAQYDFIAHPYGEATQIGEMTTTMNDSTGRWAWNRQDYGHVFTGTAGSQSVLLTLGGTLNDQHNTVVGVPTGFLGDPLDAAADFMGTLAPSIRNQASQPVQGLKLSTMLAAPRSSWLTLAQENALYGAGVSLMRSDSFGNVTIGQAVTTYTENAFGQADASYRYVTTMFTLMAITRQLKAALVTKFGRCTLVPNGTRVNPNVAAVSPIIIQAEIIAQYYIMEANGLVVNAAAMAAATIVQINANNPNRVDIIWRPELANGLSFIGTINQFILNPLAAV